MSATSVATHGGGSAAPALPLRATRRRSVAARLRFRQLHADQPARIPRHAARPDRRVEDVVVD